MGPSEPDFQQDRVIIERACFKVDRVITTWTVLPIRTCSIDLLNVAVLLDVFVVK